jgi:hypothetical protein
VPEQQSAELEVGRDAEVTEAGEQRDWLQRQEFSRIDAEVLASRLIELKLHRDGEQLILVHSYRS